MSKYKINKGFIVQKLDGKTAIFDSATSQLYTFNETATLVFQKLKAGKSEQEIIATFIKKYGIKIEKAKQDVNELLHVFVAKKIISIAK